MTRCSPPIPITGEQAGEGVTHLWVHEDELTDLQTTVGEVTTTEDHPFWNATDQQWQGAEELDTGDALLTADGGTIAVVRLDSSSVREDTAYNLTVDRLHTYYVTVGDVAVLVHNTCGFPNRELPRDPRTREPVPDPDPDAVGVPHTQLGMKEGSSGPYPQAREFDADGRPVRDIDFTDHNRPLEHANPHQHQWVPNSTGGSLKRNPPGPLN